MHIPPKVRRNRTYGCGELREHLTRAAMPWKLAMVGADRLIGRAEFRLRPGGAPNKARWGADWAGTVELVDKRSVLGCDPASSVPEKAEIEKS
jgi:hypothetical protein